MRFYTRVGVVSLAVAAIAASATAQTFVNGGFEDGTLSGWTVTLTVNGATNFQTVEMLDIDGPGALGVSNAAKFGVGRAVSGAGGVAGVELTQSMSLTAGVQYTFSFNWAALRDSATNNAEGGVFDFIVDGVSIGQQTAGATSSVTPHYGFLSGTYTPGSTGSFIVGARIARPFTVPGDLHQHVDNFSVSAVPEPASMMALGAGAIGVLLRRRRK
jgi:hypothetical protein